MLLYAIVQSERAHKAQGGNKFITVCLRVGDRTISRVVATLQAKGVGDDVTVEYENEAVRQRVRHSFPLKSLNRVKGEKPTRSDPQ